MQKVVPIVLVAQDYEPFRYALITHLGREGFEIIEAIDDLDALQKARDHFGGIDVLVTDQMMPRLGGTDLVCALKAELPELRVLFITGEPIEIVGDRTGWMTAFLRKPCDLADVVVRSGNFH